MTVDELRPAADVIDLAVDPPPRKEWPLTMLYRFDPLLLPHKDKSWIVADEKYKAVWRKAGYVEAVVLRHGRIAGTWRYDKKRSGLEVTVGLFGRIPAREAKALGWQAESVAAYFGLPLEKFEIG